MSAGAVFLGLVCLLALNSHTGKFPPPQGWEKGRSGELSKDLVFETKHFYRESSECRVDKDPCTKVTVEYPVAVKGPKKLRNFINDTLMYRVGRSLTIFNPANKPGTEDLETLAEHFDNDYLEFVRDMEGEYKVTWEVETIGTVTYQSPEIVSVVLKSFSYTGGAHPNSFRELVCFDLKAQKLLTIEDLIENKTALKELAERYFRKYHQLEENADLNESGFFWDDDFYLPENFAVDKNGVIFYYNPYEVAAYAVGATELMIPWSELKGILKPGFSF